MLIKGTKHIEALAKAKQIALDKTGTITTGKMEIEKIVPLGDFRKEKILSYVYALEKNSNHPISTAIAKEVEKQPIEGIIEVEKQEEIAGYGIKGEIQGKQVLFGNRRLLEKENIKIPENIEEANYFVVDEKLEAYFIVKEEIREECKNLVENFKKVNIEHIFILTGDSQKNAEKIAKEIGITQCYASLLPQDKLEKGVIL